MAYEANDFVALTVLVLRAHEHVIHAKLVNEYHQHAVVYTRGVSEAFYSEAAATLNARAVPAPALVTKAPAPIPQSAPKHVSHRGPDKIVRKYPARGRPHTRNAATIILQNALEQSHPGYRMTANGAYALVSGYNSTISSKSVGVTLSILMRNGLCERIAPGTYVLSAWGKACPKDVAVRHVSIPKRDRLLLSSKSFNVKDVASNYFYELDEQTKPQEAKRD